MDTLSLAVAILALLAGLFTVLAAVSLRLGRKRSKPAEESHFDPGALADPRSGLQSALVVLDEVLVTDDEGADARRVGMQLVQLLRNCPSLAFAEVIDDRALWGIENSTSAKCVWIVSTDETIEFEYPSGVSFSGVVLDNLRRGISYRYFVMETDTTRMRAEKLVDLVRKEGLDDRLQIRFLPDRYWEKLRDSADELIAFESKGVGEMFYRLPVLTVSDGMRKWITMTGPESGARIRDLSATWELARPAIEETELA